MVLMIIYVSVFGAIVGLAAYLVGNAKSQSKPWFFLVAAVVAILFGYWVQVAEANRASTEAGSKSATAGLAELLDLTCKAAEAEHSNAATASGSTLQDSAKLISLACQVSKTERAKSAGAANPMLEHLAQIIVLTSSVFAGALASVAITNRAKFQHDQETARLKADLAAAVAVDKWLKSQLNELRVKHRAAADSRDPADMILAKQDVDAVERLAEKNFDRKEALEKQLSELGERDLTLYFEKESDT